MLYTQNAKFPFPKMLNDFSSIFDYIVYFVL
jgi:hypothetical protein